MKYPCALVLAGLLAGCGPKDHTPAKGGNTAAPDISTRPPETRPSVGLPPDAWIGKWVGVEGLALVIARSTTPGAYALTVSLLDGTSHYVGTAQGESIVFSRDGHEERIRKASGAETGLKWLADKKNCLMIQPSEGFCRD